MKLKLNQINPNPFKKEINKGHLDKEQVQRIKSNIKELGLMGSIPVVKIEGKYHCVSHHHRVQALKEVYGNNFEVEVVLHNYSDDQLLRGMVIENLTQRAGDFKEEVENLVVIRNYLKKTTRSNSEQVVRKQGGGTQPEAGSIRHIADWLNKTGEVMSIGKISTWLSMHDKLDKSILEDVEFNVGHTHKNEDGKKKISIEDAKYISTIENKEHQKKMKEIITDVMDSPNPMNYKQKIQAIKTFKEAPEQLKKKILEKKVPLQNAVLEAHRAEVGKVDLSREKHYIEYNYEMMNKLKDIFKEKMYLKKCPPSELEIMYHYLLNWTREELIPFMKEIEKEFRARGKKDVVIFDLVEKGDRKK